MKLGEFSEDYVLARGKRMYEEGQARIDVDPGHTALMVIDMTDEFVKPHWTPYWIPEATRQVPRIRSLIDKFHEVGWPVIYSADEDRLGGLNIPTVIWLVPAGESMADFPEVFTKVLIYEELKPQDGDLVLQKHGYGCFFQTALDTVLKRLDVTTLVICGTVTNICCGTTAREAFAYGYKVIFGSDVNSSDDADQHNAEVKSLRRAFARIMSAAEIETAVDAVVKSGKEPEKLRLLTALGPNGLPVEQLSFGLSLPNRAVLFGVPIDTLFQITQAAEDSHLFRSVWVGDNFLSKPRLEAIVLLSALAARTTRLHLGTVCLATFPMRHPLQLAIQWASLDLIAGGRSILAVCLGQSANDDPKFAAEYQAMGIRNAERVGRLEEGIDLLRRFWAGGPVTHSGRFYNFEGVDPLPKPLQPSLPIVIAANPWGARDDATKERIMRRVAKLGDGWQTDGIPPRQFASAWASIRAYAGELGRADKVNHASLHLMVNINADAIRARRDAVEFLDHYYGVGTVSEEKIAAWLAAGPPEAVAETIDSYVQAGCTTIIVRFAGSDQMNQLNQFIENVLPAFAGRLTTA